MLFVRLFSRSLSLFFSMLSFFFGRHGLVYRFGFLRGLGLPAPLVCACVCVEGRNRSRRKLHILPHRHADTNTTQGPSLAALLICRTQTLFFSSLFLSCFDWNRQMALSQGCGGSFREQWYRALITSSKEYDCVRGLRP